MQRKSHSNQGGSTQLLLLNPGFPFSMTIFSTRTSEEPFLIRPWAEASQMRGPSTSQPIYADWNSASPANDTQDSLQQGQGTTSTALRQHRSTNNRYMLNKLRSQYLPIAIILQISFALTPTWNFTQTACDEPQKLLRLMRLWNAKIENLSISSNSGTSKFFYFNPYAIRFVILRIQKSTIFAFYSAISLMW